MLISFFHVPPSARHRVARQVFGFMAATLAVTLLANAHADVGLPVYDGPVFHDSRPHDPDSNGLTQSNLANDAVVRQISTGTALSCDQARSDKQSGSALDFAPPADFRSVVQDAHDQPGIQVPLIIRGNRAVLQTGKVLNTAHASLHEGRLLLLSADRDFFNSLQSIQVNDRLLVQTHQTVRQYQVTRARLTRFHDENLSLDERAHREDAREESLSLIACYPFQPVDGQPLFYELRAQPMGASIQSASETGSATPKLVNF